MRRVLAHAVLAAVGLSNLYIGASNLQVATTPEDIYGPFIGRIQEVAVYNRALTDQELAAQDIAGNL
jgi:hypothetical protein